MLVWHFTGVTAADDWLTYRHDVTHSGVSSENLPGNLSLQWAYVPMHLPRPAWPAPSEEMPRMHTDDAFHVALADSRVFFGSSVTNEVSAIDATSGDISWSFFTEGPVRFAPAVHNGRVYAGSDDGYLNPKTVYSQNHFANYGIKFNLHEVILKNMGYFCHDFKGIRIEGTKTPWLFTSGCLGLVRREIPVRDKETNHKVGIYTVRLGFRAGGDDKPGRRVCDIKLQDRIVSKDFDIARISEGADKAVIQEFKDIPVDGDLLLEFVPKTTTPDKTQAPLISFVEILQQDKPLLAKHDGRTVLQNERHAP
jgi:hypothetical protein